MSNVRTDPDILALEPHALWQIFSAICARPHASGHETELREYIRDFALARGCEVKTDEIGNLLLSKAASNGCEHAKSVVLQAHLDMVTQKNSDLQFDFLIDAIKPIVAGNKVTATGTTLGADNGIGVAAALAVITADNIQHGPLQCLFTVEEETGLFGASALTAEFVNADIMLNLDGEDLREIYIGCAGGARTTVTFEFMPEPVAKNYIGMKVTITGMKGGHSGADINAGRGNAHKELAMFLSQAAENLSIQLSDIHGGNADNAIPRESFVTFALPGNEVEALESFTAGYLKKAIERLGARAPDFKLKVNSTDCPDTVFPAEFQQQLLKAINESPDGVIALSKTVPGLVETSTTLAIITTTANEVTLKSSQRSAINQQRELLSKSLLELWSVYGGIGVIDSEYPGWEPQLESTIITTAVEAYQQELGFKPQPTAIHAGLECGIIGGLNPAMEIISFGPDIDAPHSPDENVDIASVMDFWVVLLEILHKIAT
ncbi:MAG: beta-Ala-His dipeptidase [Victivallaceae bacterium]|nr:beta-Ala-His dipeptidase [Victivallaceae bacterium]